MTEPPPTKRRKSGLQKTGACPPDDAELLPTLRENLFGDPPSSTSLIDAIFGAGDGDRCMMQPSGSLCDDNKVDAAVQERIKSNLQKHSVPRRPNESVRKSAADTSHRSSSSVDKIVTQRRRHWPPEAVDTVSSMAPYGDNVVTDEDMKVPLEERVKEIARIVQTHGFAVVRNAVPGTVMDELSRVASQIQDQVCERLDEKGIQWRCGHRGSRQAETFRFVEVASRCSGRMDVRYRTGLPPFSDPCIVENESLMPILNNLLGGSNSPKSSDAPFLPKLLYAGLIFSFPGSDNQPWHQDGMPLFPELSDLEFPSYAMNVFLPLSDEDCSVEAGPTEFIAGSHAMEEHAVMDAIDSAMASDDDAERTSSDDDDTPAAIISPILSRGDALLYDYRVCHRGTSNLTGRVRRILYLMYARPWFHEHMNFGEDRLFRS